jgi:hypothetical protein
MTALAMLDNFAFDYKGFYEKLLRASRQSFQLIKDRYPNDTFYCFAFFSHGSYSFVHTAASSEEGLTREAQDYVDRFPESWGQFSLTDVRLSLRHSLPGSPLLEADITLSIFEEVCDLAWERSDALQEIWSSLADELGNDEAFRLVKPHKDQFLDTCFNVLRKLDSERMFGTGLARERVLLNFLMGDQGNYERLTNAHALNPKHIVERYQAEIEAGREIGDRIFRSQYKPK